MGDHSEGYLFAAYRPLWKLNCCSKFLESSCSAEVQFLMWLIIEKWLVSADVMVHSRCLPVSLVFFAMGQMRPLCICFLAVLFHELSGTRSGAAMGFPPGQPPLACLGWVRTKGEFLLLKEAPGPYRHGHYIDSCCFKPRLAFSDFWISCYYVFLRWFPSFKPRLVFCLSFPFYTSGNEKRWFKGLSFGCL